MENKTAVKWLVNELNNQKCWADPARIEIIVQQALEMEKQQIVNAWFAGYLNGESKTELKSEQYYSETYKKPTE